MKSKNQVMATDRLIFARQIFAGIPLRWLSLFFQLHETNMAGHRRSKRKAEQSLGTRRSSRRSAARDDDDNLYGQDYGILPSD